MGRTPGQVHIKQTDQLFIDSNYVTDFSCKKGTSDNLSSKQTGSLNRIKGTNSTCTEVTPEHLSTK